MDTEYPIVPQPENFSRSLFDHQKTSIYEMEEFERERTVNINSVYNLETNFGIQADPTGYGKTASMVGLIVRDSMSWDLDTPQVIEEPYSINEGCKITKKFTLRCSKINGPTFIKKDINLHFLFRLNCYQFFLQHQKVPEQL